MASSRYWREREKANKRRYSRKDRAAQKEVRKIHKTMQDEIQKEINAFYGKYAVDEGISLAEAKRRADKLDIEAYARKAERYVAEKNFSKQANAEMKLYNLTMKVNRLELLKAEIGLEMIKAHDDINGLTDRVLLERAEEEFRRQAGILGETVNDVSGKARRIADASFHNATWRDRAWTNHAELKANLDVLLQRGLIRGDNPRKLARSLHKALGADLNKCERLMTTELARVQIDASADSFAQNGFERYQYITCGYGDACDMCKPLDGKDFAIKDMEVGVNAPPMHPWCHCSIAPYEDSEEYDAWLDFLDKGGTTEEWDVFGKDNWRESKRTKTSLGSKSDELTNRRKERLAAREAEKSATANDFSKMTNGELQKYAETNLKTKFVDFKGVSNEFAADAVKVMSEFEQKLGGTLGGLKVQFGGTPKGVSAKYDDITNTLYLKKTGTRKAFEEREQAANFRYMHKWKTDRPYYATETYAGTIWHELGHAVDCSRNQALSRALSQTAELDELSIKISSYARTTQNIRVTKRSEAWAENFAAYMSGNKYAGRVPREIVKMIEDYFETEKKKRKKR